MSDDIWRSDDEVPEVAAGTARGASRAEMDSFSDDEFGGPLFGDTSENPRSAARPSDPPRA